MAFLANNGRWDMSNPIRVSDPSSATPVIGDKALDKSSSMWYNELTWIQPSPAA